MSDFLLDDDTDFTSLEPETRLKTGGMRLRSGEDWELEEQALAILMNDRRSGCPEHSRPPGHPDGEFKCRALPCLNHWLTPSQIEDRQLKEVYVSVGVPEESFTRGALFKRAYNPNLSILKKSSDNQGDD